MKTLKQALREFRSDERYKKPEDIHWFVWLLENPKSPLHLSGAVSLFNHDIIHVLLNRNMDVSSEAYVIGFTMGNSEFTGKFTKALFKFSAKWLYPDGYRFTETDISEYDRGFVYGCSLKTKNIHEKSWTEHSISTKLSVIREKLGITVINTKVTNVERLDNDVA
jgi:hypothetical protein